MTDRIDHRSLVLFDIDGTLMITGGATSRAILRAFQAIHGDTVEWGGVTVGTLDPQIYEQLAKYNGIESPGDAYEAYRERYLKEMAAELERAASDITILPGIASLLKLLHEREHVTLGLLSGNLRKAAMLKITAAGFDPTWFDVKVFAEDGVTRDDLPHAALKQWSDLVGPTVDPCHALIVGDTPRDIQCARAAGIQVFSVATGHYTLDQLREHEPDMLLADLSDSSSLLSLLDHFEDSGLR